MKIFKHIWCGLFHSKSTTWKRHGDWLFYTCSKCEQTWPEPDVGQNPRGKRVS